MSNILFRLEVLESFGPNRRRTALDVALSFSLNGINMENALTATVALRSDLELGAVSVFDNDLNLPSTACRDLIYAAALSAWNAVVIDDASGAETRWRPLASWLDDHFHSQHSAQLHHTICGCMATLLE